MKHNIYHILNLQENNFASGKWILIFDLKNVTIAHMREYTPIILKNLMDALLTAFPIRPQGVHAVNLPPYLEWIFNLIKSFVSKKLADRVSAKLKLRSKLTYFHIYNTNSTIFRYIFTVE